MVTDAASGNTNRPSDPHPGACITDSGPNPPSLAQTPPPGPTRGEPCHGIKCKLKKLITPECIGAGFDAAGALALAAGPEGVPLAAAAFGASSVASAQQHDYPGFALGTAAWSRTPLGFSEFSRLLKAISDHAGYVATSYSAASCILSWF